MGIRDDDNSIVLSENNADADCVSDNVNSVATCDGLITVSSIDDTDDKGEKGNSMGCEADPINEEEK